MDSRLWKKILCLLAFSFSNSVKANTPPSIGNFSLVASQEPGPFFSFGQNIIDKDQLLVFVNPNYLDSPSQHIIEETPSVLYGFASTASLLLTLPLASNYTNGNQKLAGIGDFSLDLEYAYYNFSNSKYSDQATLIFSPTFPSSNLDEQPTTKHFNKHRSRGARKNSFSNTDTISYFFGTTYARTLVDWYGFISPGVLVLNKDKGLQQGEQFFYNLGIGRNIKSAEQKYIFFGLVEINGQYTAKNTLNARTVPNTGGNIIYATPSLWYSTPKFIFQLGISLPINQYWYGNQDKIAYFASGIISWTIQ